VIAAVASVVAGRKPLSVALGEARDAASQPTRLPSGVTYGKVGLSGCSAQRDWADHWRLVLERLPAETSPVAVAYADWTDVDAPSPLAILEHGRALGCRAFLLDTFCKSAGGLFDRWSMADVARLIGQVQQMGLLAVIGGSLSETNIERAAALRPDFVAVRGAACRGGREAALDGQRVRRLANLVHAVAARHATGTDTRCVAGEIRATNDWPKQLTR
jgi:uncharacterized protein (UPF0264 family)